MGDAEMTNAQYDRLPKYAREELTDILRKIHEKQQKINAFTCFTTDGDRVVIDPYSRDDSVTLPPDTQVAFHTGKDHYVVRMSEGKLKVYCTDSLHMECDSSNIVDLDVRER